MGKDTDRLTSKLPGGLLTHWVTFSVEPVLLFDLAAAGDLGCQRKGSVIFVTGELHGAADSGLDVARILYRVLKNFDALW